MPGVVRNTSSTAAVCVANWSAGAEIRTVAVLASAPAQRSASRPEASESAIANTARKVIAAAVNPVSHAP